MSGRGPDIAAHRKGQPYFLPKSSYLSANLYRVEWLDDRNHLHDEQVLADTAVKARDKASHKFKAPKMRMAATLIMRKGAFKPTGLHYI